MQISLPITTPTQQAPNRFGNTSGGLNLTRQTLAAVYNSSLIIKILSIGVLLGYFISHTELTQYLCIIPGKLLPPNFWLWTLATHSFIETSFIQVLCDLVLIFLYTKLLEPLWSTQECLVFYAVCTISVGICTCFIYLAIYAATFQENLIFNTQIYGLASLIGGFSVAIKQIMPDTLILALGAIRIRQDDIPLILVLVSLLLELVGLVDKTYFIQILFGILTSWIYLRFYQKHKNGSRGDQSNAFSFASFFPSIVQPVISILANTIYDILVRVKICKKVPKRYNVGAPSTITISIPSVGGNSLDVNNDAAERRRQKALKALNERLKKPDTDTKWTDEPLNEPVELPIDKTIATSTTVINLNQNETDNNKVVSSQNNL